VTGGRLAKELRALLATELFGLALRIDVQAVYDVAKMIVAQQEQQYLDVEYRPSGMRSSGRCEAT
jgi:hypothetical protein